MTTPPPVPSLPDLGVDVLHHVVASIGGRPRQGQDDALRAALETIAAEQRIALKCPTGSGKSLIALVAAMLTGHRTLISSATNSLLRQYVVDAAEVAAAFRCLGVHRSVAVLLGKLNYPCSALADRHVEGAQQSFDGMDRPKPTQDRAVSEAASWALSAAAQGKVVTWADYPDELDSRVKEQLSVDADSCAGRRCKFYDDCHSVRARKTAAASNVVLISHASLCIPTVDPFEGGAELVVVDEVHQLEDFAIGGTAIDMTVRPDRSTWSELGDRLMFADTVGLGTIAALRELGVEWWRKLDREVPEGEHEIGPDWAAEELASLVDRSVALLADVEQLVDMYDPDELDAADSIRLRKAASLLASLQWMVGHMADEDPSNLVTVVKEAGRATVTMRQVNVSGFLRDHVWRDRPVVAMSATIPEGYVERVGMEGDRVVKVSSPFDYRTRQPILVADHLPPAEFSQRDQWRPAAVEVARRATLSALQTGSVLVVCTSFAMARDFAAGLSDVARLSGAKMLLNDQPRQDIEAFVADYRAARRAVLIGGPALGTGVNAPGKTRLVIIPALPFTPKDDPILGRRKQLWPHRAIPHPIEINTIAAKIEQWSGRLMRTETDRGLVLFLDPRITTKNYAPRLRHAFNPDAMVFGQDHLDDLLVWLATDIDASERAA